MDYEKKYKEKVIELLNNTELTQEQKNKLESIFPELAESKDEKIRKFLAGYFNQYKIDGFPEFSTGMKVDDIVAWLEKQKAIDVLNEEEREFADNIDSYRKEVDAAYQKGYNEGVKATLEKQSKQKLAEWSEEDEWILNEAINAVIVSDYAEGRKETCIDWLTSLKERV